MALLTLYFLNEELKHLSKNKESTVNLKKVLLASCGLILSLPLLACQVSHNLNAYQKSFPSHNQSYAQQRGAWELIQARGKKQDLDLSHQKSFSMPASPYPILFKSQSEYHQWLSGIQIPKKALPILCSVLLCISCANAAFADQEQCLANATIATIKCCDQLGSNDGRDASSLTTDEQSDQLAAASLWKSQLYAPWRESYKQKVPDDHNSKCAFCTQIAENDDDSHFILKRTDHFIVMLNLHPYNKGHTLIVPKKHIKNLYDLNSSAQLELMSLQVETIEILKQRLDVEAFNVGINIGTDAGASIADHLHWHIVPRYPQERWSFMNTVANTNVISWDLKNLYTLLKPAFNA